MRFGIRSRKLNFTREGKIYVFLCLAIGIAAINTGSNLLFLLLSVMLSVIISSGVISESGLRYLNVKRLGDIKVFCDKPFLYRFEVENNKKIFPSFCINLKEDTLGEASQFILRLAPRSKTMPFVKAVLKRRGVQKLDKITLESTYPFGLFKKTKIIYAKGTVTVLPVIKKIPAGFLRTSVKERDKELPASFWRMGKEHFFGLKEYRDGDNPRLIYWKSMAKYRIPMVKEYEESAGDCVDVILDLSFEEDNGDKDNEKLFESAICLCASLIDNLAGNNPSLGFKIIRGNGIFYEQSKNGSTKEKALEKLATLDIREFCGTVKKQNPEPGHFNSGNNSVAVVLCPERRDFYRGLSLARRGKYAVLCMCESELLKEYYPYEN